MLWFDGERFVEQIMARVRAVGAHPCVVLGHEAGEVRSRAALDDATVLINEAYETEEMLSSVRTGVREAKRRDDDAVIMWPVDYPCASAAVAEQLVRSYRETEGADIVVPTYEGDGGHPALFGSTAFDPLINAPDNVGARAVVYGEAIDRRELAVADPGIHVDIDTPEEYWAAVKRFG